MKEALQFISFVFILWIIILSFLLYRDYQEDRKLKNAIKVELVEALQDELKELQKLIR